MIVRVVALEECFVQGARRRVGAEFDYDAEPGPGSHPILPKYLAPAGEAAHALIAQRRKAQEDAYMAGALAATGK